MTGLLPLGVGGWSFHGAGVQSTTDITSQYGYLIGSQIVGNAAFVRSISGRWGSFWHMSLHDVWHVTAVGPSRHRLPWHLNHRTICHSVLPDLVWLMSIPMVTCYSMWLSRATEMSFTVLQYRWPPVNSCRWVFWELSLNFCWHTQTLTYIIYTYNYNVVAVSVEGDVSSCGFGVLLHSSFVSGVNIQRIKPPVVTRVIPSGMRFIFLI